MNLSTNHIQSDDIAGKYKIQNISINACKSFVSAGKHIPEESESLATYNIWVPKKERVQEFREQ